jgi:hypothetical protein
MKLEELLLEKFGDDAYYYVQFRKLELEPLKEELLKCDEFSEFEGIEFMELPTEEIEGTTYLA